MTKSRFRNTVLGIGATAAALALGYFGVQQLGRNTLFPIAAAVGGAADKCRFFTVRRSYNSKIHQQGYEEK
ncbi:hypothetical protein ACEYW6_36865, partial [Nostoc sp. UIC 10607]|uniref:hypothetical protein n=1 Tax=Nostoc sp. UIC 10607 TaxID=3045935 RepID=UPI0039A0A4BC